MILYFDTCCLNRPHDDQRQTRIAQETEAVISLLQGVRQGSWDMATSDVLNFEVSQIRDNTRCASIMSLLSHATVLQPLTPEVEDRATTLSGLGFKPLDALHLACAEAIPVTLFLTTDDRLLSAAHRHAATLQVKVANPAKTDIFNP